MRPVRHRPTRSVPVLVIAAVSLCAAGCSSDDNGAITPTKETTTTVAPTTSPPTTVIDPAELPAVDATSAAADLKYLAAAGAPLVKMVELLEDEDVVSDCSRLITELADLANPAEMVELLVPVSDEVLSTALSGARSGAVALAAECQGGDGPGDAKKATASAIGLFRQRQAQLEKA